MRRTFNNAAAVAAVVAAVKLATKLALIAADSTLHRHLRCYWEYNAILLLLLLLNLIYRKRLVVDTFIQATSIASVRVRVCVREEGKVFATPMASSAAAATMMSKLLNQEIGAD